MHCNGSSSVKTRTLHDAPDSHSRHRGRGSLPQWWRQVLAVHCSGIVPLRQPPCSPESMSAPSDIALGETNRVDSAL